MNPAVLTCGALYLDKADPGEVRSAAGTRQFLDKYVTPAGLTVFVLALGLLKVVGLAIDKGS